MNDKIIFNHKRCKHEMIAEFCTECTGKKSVKDVNRMLERRTKKKKREGRKANGQFDLKLKNKMLNTGFIVTGIAIILFSAFHYFSETPVEKRVFTTPVSAMHLVGPAPSPTPTIAIPPTVEEEIREVFGEHTEEALKVARCESGLRETVCNDGLNRDGTVDCGSFQVNSNVHKISRKWLKNMEINIRVAKQLFDEQGWTPWYSSYSCHGLN